jgi:DNA-binding MarR family transcriptional regulator
MAGTSVSIVLSEKLSASAVRLARSLPPPRPATSLTPPELSALAAISSAGEIAARDLALKEDVTAATMSRVVASLDRKGLVRRKRDRKDARLYWITLTALGAQRVREGRLRQIAPLAAAIARLDRKKRATLTEAADILESLVAGLQRPAE